MTVVTEIPAITDIIPPVMTEIMEISTPPVPAHFITIIAKIVAVMTDVNTVMTNIPAIFPTALSLRSNTGKQTSSKEYK
jgi:hypothetical protein